MDPTGSRRMVSLRLGYNYIIIDTHVNACQNKELWSQMDPRATPTLTAGEQKFKRGRTTPRSVSRDKSLKGDTPPSLTVERKGLLRDVPPLLTAEEHTSYRASIHYSCLECTGVKNGHTACLFWD